VWVRNLTDKGRCEEKGNRYTVTYEREGKMRVRKKANRIKEVTGILDHGQESPHRLFDVSYLTSGT